MKSIFRSIREFINPLSLKEQYEIYLSLEKDEQELTAKKNELVKSAHSVREVAAQSLSKVGDDQFAIDSINERYNNFVSSSLSEISFLKDSLEDTQLRKSEMISKNAKLEAYVKEQAMFTHANLLIDAYNEGQVGAEVLLTVKKKLFIDGILPELQKAIDDTLYKKKDIIVKSVVVEEEPIEEIQRPVRIKTHRGRRKFIVKRVVEAQVETIKDETT